MPFTPACITDEALLQWSKEQGFSIFFRSPAVDLALALHDLRDFYTAIQHRLIDYFDSIAEFT